jgi:uncharacterized damage-inducible protein DinB
VEDTTNSLNGRSRSRVSDRSVTTHIGHCRGQLGPGLRPSIWRFEGRITGLNPNYSVEVRLDVLEETTGRPFVRMSRVLEMVRDLVAHKGHANAALLMAIRQNPTAASNPELCELLQHILLANRFWLLSILGLRFVLADESRASSSFDALVERFCRTQQEESEWLATATETDLARVMENALIPGSQCSVSQALVQVCLHSHGHRAQCAKLLRRHGGVPPRTDFILWLATRPSAEWTVAQDVTPE